MVKAGMGCQPCQSPPTLQDPGSQLHMGRWDAITSQVRGRLSAVEQEVPMCPHQRLAASTVEWCLNPMLLSAPKFPTTEGMWGLGSSVDTASQRQWGSDLAVTCSVLLTPSGRCVFGLVETQQLSSDTCQVRVLSQQLSSSRNTARGYFSRVFFLPRPAARGGSLSGPLGPAAVVRRGPVSVPEEAMRGRTWPQRQKGTGWAGRDGGRFCGESSGKAAGIIRHPDRMVLP